RGSCISSIPRIASAAKDHEHDIHNARPSNPVYTGPKFNSLLGQRGKRYGLQTMCEGGGLANVTIVERL
ncbi:hypothetical protein, partial [Paraburkholderia sp. BR10954]|uniref:hypothetical protein n=1 Tax=Paraburkholderia sp. BR10954 TaxID=3236995 RepID=UPI0034D184FF